MLQIATEEHQVILHDVTIAQTFWQRFKGLMFEKSIDEEAGLLFEKCQSIHCCFMRMAIDVIFLTQTGEIVHLIERMSPWTFSRIVRRAAFVVECAPGTIAKYGLALGQSLLFQESESAPVVRVVS